MLDCFKSYYIPPFRLPIYAYIHSNYDETKNNDKTIPWATEQLARGKKNEMIHPGFVIIENVCISTSLTSK